MLIPFRKFRATDLEVLIPNSIDEVTRNLKPEVWKSWGEYDEKMSVGYTACIDNIPIMAAGIRYIRPGVGTAWAYMTTEAMNHKLSILKSTKLMLKYVLEACTYRQVRASARIELSGADVLAKHLGFKRVRKMVKGTHDYYILKVKDYLRKVA